MAIAKPRAYEKIKLAIIQQAIEDYKEAIPKGRKRRIAEIEKFFRSKWCADLTGNNGTYILNKIKKELGVEEDVKNWAEKRDILSLYKRKFLLYLW